ncbi:unnamed protein product, partial [Adineta ricciae]
MTTHHRCLFCGAHTATNSCCSSCREMDRCVMFDALLKLLGNATKANNYYDQIKSISHEIGTLEWLLTPLPFTPITYFDSNIHRIDQCAKEYLENGCTDIQGMVPVEVLGDGNCLYNSIICLSGTKKLSVSELRVRTIIELVENDIFYHNHFSHVVGPLDEVVRSIAHNYSYSELYEIVGLSNVLKCNIRSIYPRIQYRSELNIFNNIFQSNKDGSTPNTIYILWSNTQSEIYARSCNAGNWTPNHFVPLLAVRDDTILQNTFSSADVAFSNTTPTKSTTKNAVSTPVRVPHFVDPDHGMDVPSKSLTCSTDSNSTSSNNIKRKGKYMKGNESTEVQAVKNEQILARERSAARRAVLSSAQMERQRTLDRERKAANRAALTPDQAARQRVIEQERSEARRSTLSSEEVERQRALARDRSMARRAIASPAESEAQRVLARERSSTRRAFAAAQSAEQLETSGEKQNRSQEHIDRKTAAAHRKTDSVEVDWPKPVDLECKKSCLKNFIQSMSMKALEEGVCSICNISCYKRDLRCVPYNKIPSIELLKAHDDLYNMICG